MSGLINRGSTSQGLHLVVPLYHASTLECWFLKTVNLEGANLMNKFICIMADSI